MRVPRVTLLTLLLALPAFAQGKPQKSLYERLGGAYPISVVVDDFINRLSGDGILNANPAIREARERVPLPGLKYQVTTLVCQLAGGPERYNGRTMKESHDHLGITEREWDEMVLIFKQCLDHYKVPDAEQKELFAAVGAAKPDIVKIAKK
ncbi:MAG: group 1 truncated hemoglobin [Acidobacteria bacterium]|nr:group 1 truncated hemoglobin [Acidobacteriota bacterium]